ncbi:DUF6680 family protein [Pseudaminobacter soli (ex Li et al. 2025)]|uniref:DUF6680 family protein n=1 Tax=Pseudaminobacter soli (ex Li et al. 2025) TaxID=1295366 RepID=UPI0011B1E17D|nr:DUF6680 family protein [Mesorhizobium soli]
MFLGLRWVDLVTIAAIVLGPILAVAADRFQRQWAEKRQRRLEVFRDLMRTRKARLDPMHVGALNLVDLEFYGCRPVTGALRTYINHLFSPMPNPDEHDRFSEQRNDLLMDLLHEMGRELGYSYDRRDLERLSYGPRGWTDDQDLQRHNMTLLNQMLQGRIALPVTPMQPTAQNPFPPAPAIKDTAPPAGN